MNLSVRFFGLKKSFRSKKSMIICHKYKFIFIKTRKTAGTSLEIALSQFCDSNDIITPIIERDELIRRNLGYQGPVNCHLPVVNYSFKDWVKLLKMERPKYNPHTTASQICPKIIQREIWDTYFKFSIERNPWDKAISLYYFEIRNKKNPPSFSEFIKTRDKRLTNFDIYSIKGQMAVNYVMRYENLEMELDKITKHLNLPGKLILPNAKSHFRKDRRPYREVVGENERKIIDQICAREIEYFGFQFEAGPQNTVKEPFQLNS